MTAAIIARSFADRGLALDHRRDASGRRRASGSCASRVARSTRPSCRLKACELLADEALAGRRAAARRSPGTGSPRASARPVRRAVVPRLERGAERLVRYVVAAERPPR